MSYIGELRQRIAALEAENAGLRELIEDALRAMSSDGDATIDWANIREVLMSYATAFDPEGWRQKASNLAMLVRRLCRRVSKLSPPLSSNDKLVAQAHDYLKRMGLQGSILRTDEQTESSG